MLRFYEVQLILLVTLCVLFLFYEKYASPRQSTDTDNVKGGPLGKSAVASAKLANQYLVVYAVVMGTSSIITREFQPSFKPKKKTLGADWLQGPYIYSLYREEYAFPEMWVAILYVTGFMSAGLTAPLVGVWADQ
jgi:MFS transporter, MFS domain-containing protein family, molybdate-anion transporter